MNAYDMLIQDHEKVEMLFEEYEALDDSQGEAKLEIAALVCEELTVHALLEEEVFYPAARDALSADDLDMIDHAEKEHAQAKKLIKEIKKLKVGEELDEKMMELKTAIEHHVLEEENNLFPTLEDCKLEVNNLAKAMKKNKTELIARTT